MIKELIHDLAYDKIQLSQALTRSKLLSYKIDNAQFKRWLSKELEGYDVDDPDLPSYRVISCQMFLTFSLPNGAHHSKPILAGDESSELAEIINYLKVTEPVAVIESIISMLKDRGQVNLTAEQAQMLANLDTSQHGRVHSKWVVGGYREIAKGQYHNIMELTKQKLLDTLLELDREFPELTNEFKATNDNMEKVNNIINNNIYGNNNPLNIVAGHTVEQKDINNVFHQADFTQLEKLGVSGEEVKELQAIVEETQSDKTGLKSKVMKWLGGVTASVAGRGLYENIPAITEFVGRLIP